ncbi:MAG: hypothetical protein ACLPTJ_10610 [Solirubrobacteraceae bacterium]
MFVRKSVPMLAAAVTLLGSSAPAYAFESQAPVGGSLPPAPVVNPPAGSSDLALELAAGGVLIAGGGLAAVQLRRRSTRTVDNARVASGS